MERFGNDAKFVLKKNPFDQLKKKFFNLNFNNLVPPVTYRL